MRAMSPNQPQEGKSSTVHAVQPFLLGGTGEGTGEDPTSSFLPLPHTGTTQLEDLIELIWKKQRGLEVSLARTPPHTHTPSKVTAEVAPGFRLKSGSPGLRKPKLYRRNGGEEGPRGPPLPARPWETLPFSLPDPSNPSIPVHLSSAAPPLGQFPAHLVTWESPGTPDPHVVPSPPCQSWLIGIIHVLVRICIFLVMRTRLKGAELRGCIQDPSHILIGLGT